MKRSTDHHQAAQRVRWERMHAAIRCGLYPEQPALIRVYLGLGCWLVRQGQLDAQAANQRMLNLLLGTARDEALPWFWRSVCLEHATRPLARLTTQLKRQEPAALHLVHDTVGSLQAGLAAVSPGRATGQLAT